ncbi:MAG: L,D-transpeptidase [Cyanobacteria bacterium REEB459]|nr:L,D-transpeptidase [Cyanobacteria bacterium REEB459]
MIELSPLHRCVVVLCYGAAALLAWETWRNHGHGDRQLPSNLFQSTTLYRLTTPLAQAPQTLVAANTRVEILLGQRRLTLYQNGQVLLKAPIAIGQADWRTPVGDFAVQTMRANPVWQHPITKQAILPGPNNPLGTRWIGFLVKQGYHLGIHGTNQETLIGTAVSHGCVRMLEKDIRTLYDHVKIGTPISIKP